MAVDAADLARMYRETRERLTAPLAGLDEAELGAPVPACLGWSVSDVISRSGVAGRRHAELRRADQAWVLVGLGSKNGTRVNGWRADSGFAVRAGDWASFGAAAFRLADPA